MQEWHDDHFFHLELARMREARRRASLLEPLLTTEATYEQLRAHARHLLIPHHYLWNWHQAYTQHQTEGLIPLDWEALEDAEKPLVRERLTHLSELAPGGDLSHLVSMTKDQLLHWATSHHWSYRTGLRWYQRYIVGGV
jgi:hypothetical protein